MLCYNIPGPGRGGARAGGHVLNGAQQSGAGGRAPGGWKNRAGQRLCQYAPTKIARIFRVGLISATIPLPRRR